ncbi:unnamed protein product [Didymodactylos carnosus]|uniref:Uncharacterized protein n=1 Tax=Didymodactylos carnosus TaxID=1234261 RepID=A0A814KDQ2_9BILA|nr:unnamed protein product [Didymodactylos carnosus]CAF3819770.1 unnamed protein product [Didymodactylos carnosus]
MYADDTESNMNSDIEVISSPKGASGRTRDEIRAHVNNYDKKELSRDLLIQELVNVETRNNDLLNEFEHLTLNVDDWTIHAGRSLYEFNPITESRKCILLSLKDLTLSYGDISER